MTIQVLQRPDWHGEPYTVGDPFRLQKLKPGQSLQAICRLLTHQLGWKLRLEVNGALQRSAAIRMKVLDTFETWNAYLHHRALRAVIRSLTACLSPPGPPPPPPVPAGRPAC